MTDMKAPPESYRAVLVHDGKEIETRLKAPCQFVAVPTPGGGQILLDYLGTYDGIRIYG